MSRKTNWKRELGTLITNYHSTTCEKMTVSSLTEETEKKRDEEEKEGKEESCQCVQVNVFVFQTHLCV